MSASRIAQARIGFDSAAYSESCERLKGQLKKHAKPLSNAKRGHYALNSFLFHTLKFLFPKSPRLAAHRQNQYIAQLNDQLDSYCKVIDYEKQRQEEEKALRTKLHEGLQFKSLVSLLIKAKKQLDASLKPTTPTLAMKMPEPLLPSFADLLDSKSLSALAETSTSHAVLFQDEDLKKHVKNNKQIHNLFESLVQSDEGKVEGILKKAEKNPEDLKELLKARHTITDHADRQFDNITLFQLALWNLDEYMWRMLLKYFNKYLPEEAAAQYQAHNASGQNCPQYVKEHGKYYNSESKEEGKEGIARALEACAEAYEDHVQLYANKGSGEYRLNGNGRLSFEEANNKCRTEVTAAECRMPAHAGQSLYQEGEIRVRVSMRRPQYVFEFPTEAETRAAVLRKTLNVTRELFQVKIEKFEALKVTLTVSPVPMSASEAPLSKLR